MKVTRLLGLLFMAMLTARSIGAMAQTTIVGWDFNGLTLSGSAYNGLAFPATTVAGGVSTPGLFRSNAAADSAKFKGQRGIVGGSSAPYSENSYGGFPTNDPDLATAVSNYRWFRFKVQPAAGTTVSLSEFKMYFRDQNSPNMRVALQYSVNGGAFQTIEDTAIGNIGTGYVNQLYSKSLGSFSDLQGVSDSVNFRLVVYKGLNQLAGASLFLSDGTVGDDLVLTGTVNASGPPCTGVTPGTIGSNATNNAICNGASALLTLNNSTPVAGASYQWKYSADGATGWTDVGGNAATYNTGNLADTGYYKCIVGCASGAVFDSTPVFRLDVLPSVVPAIGSITAASTSICLNGTATLYVHNLQHTGALVSYAWKDNGNAMNTVAGTPNDTAYTTGALAAGIHNFTCTITSSAQCASPATATTVVPVAVTVNNPVSVNMFLSNNTGGNSVSAPWDTVCAGTPVVFTATYSNGGSAPAFIWQKGGVNVDTTATGSYTANTLNDGDVITCVLISSAACPSPAAYTSGSITMSVIPTVTPEVTISAAPGTTICPGTPVTFSAVDTGGGPNTPAYTWIKNGLPVGGNTATYTDNGIANGDLVSCVLTTTAACYTQLTDTSNVDTMVVNQPVIPTVTISANPGAAIVSGQSVTFTASATNTGTTAPFYQWKLNGNNVGTNASTYVNNTLANGDSVTCTVHSYANCAPDSVTSDKIVMQVTSLGVPHIANANGTIHLFPNPNNGHFTLTGSHFRAKEATLEITNTVGQTIYQEATPLNQGNLKKEIVLPSAPASGIYFIRIRTENSEDVIHFMVR